MIVFLSSSTTTNRFNKTTNQSTQSHKTTLSYANELLQQIKLTSFSFSLALPWGS
jgi:hypothetical protein